MKKLSRRDFIKICAASGAAAGLSQLWIPALAEALGDSAQEKPPVVWIQGSACGGCSTSLINTVHPGARELLSEVINLSFHPNLITGTPPMETARNNKGNFILVVEGAIPKANKGAFNIVGEDSSGNEITFIDVLSNLGSQAGSVVAVGSCASYGGISAAEPNDAYCVGIENIIDAGKVVNVPGCPPHPDWVIGTLSHLLLYGKPELDDFGRPRLFYNNLIHNNCPLRQHFDNSNFAKKIGDKGCMLLLGCKGPITFGDCPTRHWNGVSSWCVSSGAPCTGCTAPSFPELTMPFYQRMPEVNVPGITASADNIGMGLGAATAAGIAVHFAGSLVKGRVGANKSNKEGDQ